jgi:hypothetical protein
MERLRRRPSSCYEEDKGWAAPVILPPLVQRGDEGLERRVASPPSPQQRHNDVMDDLTSTGPPPLTTGPGQHVACLVNSSNRRRALRDANQDHSLAHSINLVIVSWKTPFQPPSLTRIPDAPWTKADCGVAAMPATRHGGKRGEVHRTTLKVSAMRAWPNLHQSGASPPI